MNDTLPPSPQAAEPKPWRRNLVLGVLALVLVGIGARFVLADARPPKVVTQQTLTQQTITQQNGPGLGQLKPGDPHLLEKADRDAIVEQARDWTTALPFVTEGGLALLLGIGLGLASRAAAKLLAVLALLFFAGTQYFAYQGVVAVDYAALLDWLQRFVLNVSGDDLLADLNRKLPAVGSLGVGYLIGLKR